MRSTEWRKHLYNTLMKSESHVYTRALIEDLDDAVNMLMEMDNALHRLQGMVIGLSERINEFLKESK